MIYDYVIVGAGLGGISAGINLAMNDKKVLILEKNSLPGGFVTTFKRGRYEFDVSLYDLYDYGNNEHIGSIQKLFNKYGIDIATSEIPFDSRIKILDSKEEYEIKGSIDDFFIELERFKSGSIESLKEFLIITKEVHSALEELKKGNTLVEEKYPNFNKFLTMNTIQALVELKMPRETIHRLGLLWNYIGSPLNKLSFIDFSEFMYKLIFKKVAVLNHKNIELVLKMVDKYQNYGGKIYYRTQVSNISDLNNIKIISTKDGKEYRAKQVICNVSQRYTYKNLIKEQNLEVNKLENARTLSMNGVVIYLGLNKNHTDIGLNNYKYYQYKNINSEMNIKSMSTLYHDTWEAIVPNVVNENVSPKNTTILVLKTNYYGKAFDTVSKNSYLAIKEEIANNLISQFEEAFNIDIKEYIEEIEIATPLTFNKYTNNVNGCMMGYMRLGYDNSIHRLLSYEDEVIPNLSFVGGSSLFGGGADNALYSGYFISEKLMKASENNGE